MRRERAANQTQPSSAGALHGERAAAVTEAPPPRESVPPESGIPSVRVKALIDAFFDGFEDSLVIDRDAA